MQYLEAILYIVVTLKIKNLKNYKLCFVFCKTIKAIIENKNRESISCCNHFWLTTEVDE